MAYSFKISTSKGATDTQTALTSAVDTSNSNLIVIFGSDYAIGTAVGIVDSKSNTWTQLTTRTTTTLSRIQTWYCFNPVVGTGHTFTLSGNSGQYPSVAVAAFSGALTAPFDQQNGATTLVASSLATGSVTPTLNNELVITGLASESASPAIDNGFSIVEVVAYSASAFGVALAYKLQTTAVAVNPTWSSLGASDGSAEIATFKTLPRKGLALIGVG